MREVFRAVLAAVSISGAGAGLAAEHEIAARPGAVQALVESGALAPGDRIVLGDGRHGALSVTGMAFDPPVTLTAGPGARPVLDQVVFLNAAGWVVDGVTVMPPSDAGQGGALVRVIESRDIVLDRMHIASAEDTRGWSAATWRQRARSGIYLTGRDITVRRSRLGIVRHGIASRAEGARIEDNVIELFSGDGIRGLGDRSAYVGNTIDTCVDVDGNHDDGFQSWSTGPDGTAGGGVVRDVLVEGNVILNGDHPLTCHLQGIGLFDGFFEDWTIRDNVVVVNHWHGITVMGGRRVRVEGNIVVDSEPGRPGAPWITVTAHKDGRASEDSEISGNVHQPWAGGRNARFAQPQPGVRLAGNRIVRTAAEAYAVPR